MRGLRSGETRQNAGKDGDLTGFQTQSEELKRGHSNLHHEGCRFELELVGVQNWLQAAKREFERGIDPISLWATLCGPHKFFCPERWLQPEVIEGVAGSWIPFGKVMISSMLYYDSCPPFSFLLQLGCYYYYYYYYTAAVLTCYCCPTGGQNSFLMMSYPSS